jgi:signal transduction histidine kinase
LNLQSNALKFTPGGGSVQITCKLIKTLTDLSCKEHHVYFNKTKGFGMIEISVKDTGTGIKSEDQDKLFKLFGFLDNTKDLNSKGVGLGLHISQKITQEFGGKIVLESELGQGATFTFVINLDQKSVREVAIKRYMNPVKKVYPKIVIWKSLITKRKSTK